MVSGENLFSNLLTVGILFGLTVIIYAKVSNKTLVEIIIDIREAFADKSADIYEEMPNTFQDIR